LKVSEPDNSCEKNLVRILLGKACGAIAQPETVNPSIDLGQVIAKVITAHDLGCNVSLAVAAC